MTYQSIRVSHFGGPEVLELVEDAIVPMPPPDCVRIKVLAAGTGFTDTMIRNGKYPEYRGPLPFTPGYDLVGIVESVAPGVVAPRVGEMVADLAVTGGYSQYAIRPTKYLVPVPDGIDPAEAVCMPLSFLTAWQMLTRFRALPPKSTILVVGASGAVGTALVILARHLGLKVLGTCPASELAMVEQLGATAIDYRKGDFVASVHRLTGDKGVDAAFDAIGGAHWDRSFACLAPGGLLVGFGLQGAGSMLQALLGLFKLMVIWRLFAPLFSAGRGAVFYSITSRRKAHPQQFRDDLAGLFQLLKQGAIKPVVAQRLPLSAARSVHERIGAEAFGGKVVLLPWAVPD